MMDSTATLAHFRQLISSRYKLYNLIAALSVVIFVALWILFYDHLFLKTAFSLCWLVALLILLQTITHRKRMLMCFNVGQDDAFACLENYLIASQKQWEEHIWTRIIIGTLTALSMLFMFIFFKESKWAPFTSALFVVIILTVMLKGWMNFNERILLQDIQRSHRDQPSDISE